MINALKLFILLRIMFNIFRTKYLKNDCIKYYLIEVFFSNKKIKIKKINKKVMK
jgi:hypothetical protein